MRSTGYRRSVRSTLPHDRAINLSKANVHVYSDSVLCVGKIHEHLVSTQKWKEQIGWFMGSKDFKELNGIDGHAALGLFQEIRRTMTQNGIKLEIESSSCRRTMTSIGRKVMKTSKCVCVCIELFVNTTPNPRIHRTPAHVIFLAWLKT